MSNIKYILTLVVALFMSAVLDCAHAEAKMHTTMSAKSFYVGQEFTYEILISGAKKVEPYEPDGTDDLRIQFVEQITMPQRDDSSVQHIAVRYRMIPMKPGAIHLPVFSVDADGEDLMTDEDVFIDVDRPKAYPGLAFTREMPNRDFYVGEPFRVDYAWKSPLPLSGYRAVQLYMPLFYDPHFKVRSLHHWIDPDDEAAIGFPVSNTRLVARYDELEEKGQFLNQVSFAKIVIPSKPGELVIQPASLLGSYVAPPESQRRQRGWKTSYASYFNNNFFEGVEGESHQKYFVDSSSQTIHVLPLPSAGKPHDFAGQVGKRSVTVTASPQVVAAGDPITLTIVVDDCEFLEVLELPAFDQQAAFTRQFAIPAKQSMGRIEGKKKTYIRTLRPRSQDVSAIPAIRLPYFDPTTKSYAVAETASIPITVKAAETATAFDAEVSGAGPLRNYLEKNPKGIRSNVGSLDLSANGFPTKLQLFLIFLIFPPVGFVLFYYATAQQRLMRRDPVLARANGAFKRFSQAIKQLSKSDPQSNSDESLQQLDTVVRSYFADKLNLVSHAHTFEELKVALDQREGELKLKPQIESLRQVYASCEDRTYRSKSEKSEKSDLSQLIQSAEQSILTIHRAL